MFTQTQYKKYAQLFLWGLERSKKTPLHKGDLVLVQFEAKGLPLAEHIASALIEKKYVPVLQIRPTSMIEASMCQHYDKQLLEQHIAGEKELYSSLRGLLRIGAPEKINHLNTQQRAALHVHTAARSYLTAITHEKEQRQEYGSVYGIVPTKALANAAQCTLHDYASFIIQACNLNARNPVLFWQTLAQEILELRRWLTSFGNVRCHVESDATDLSFFIGQDRQWQGLTGRNMPSFEVFVSPDWRTVEGSYSANVPSFIQGTRIDNITLMFKKGLLTSLSAEHGQQRATDYIAQNTGALRVGEFALVDKTLSRIQNFTAHTLYDENYGGEHGSMHIALGQSYANTYAASYDNILGKPVEVLDSARTKTLGFNVASLHWDIIATTPRRVRFFDATGNATTIYENGVFLF